MATPINHGSNNDRNIIVQVAYDKASRMTSLRDPRGNLTQYQYDDLNRTTQTTNPLSKVWSTTYDDLTNMGNPTGQTRRTLTDPNGVSTQQDFDRLGRLESLGYGLPGNTPDVNYTYDVAGNLVKMTEVGASSATVRETTYGYDDLRRATSVGFDNDGNGAVDETVSYEYDAGGLRAKMTMPGSLDVTYDYDERGQLVGMTDWDGNKTSFAYDLLGRRIAVKRDNGYRSRYVYDAGNRLRLLRHTAGDQVLGHFAYEVDALGNKTQAYEAVPHQGAGTTTISHDDDEVIYRGTWSSVSGYHQTTVFSASAELVFFGDENVDLKMGEGPNYSLYDIYINGALWKTFDGYATSVAERTISVELKGDGPHKLEIRNRPQHSQEARNAGGFDPSDYTLRFKSLTVDGTYDLHTIQYDYDTVYRLLEAAYLPGHNLNASAFREYDYAYDLASNRTQEVTTVAGSPSTINFTYNVANQLTSDGSNTYTYDNNGNLTNDGSDTYTWDRANRLKSVGSTSYEYDGAGNRIQKTVSSTTTDYLLDMMTHLPIVVAETTGMNTTRYVDSPIGLLAQEDNAGNWIQPVQDGLKSTRGVVNASFVMQESRLHDPYGKPFGTTGTSQTDFGFTGEQTDANDLVFLRARYYNPNMGTFLSKDSFAGLFTQPATLNYYGYTGGNPVNMVDPSGMTFCNASSLPGDCTGSSGGGGGGTITPPKSTNPKNTEVDPNPPKQDVQTPKPPSFWDSVISDTIPTQPPKSAPPPKKDTPKKAPTIKPSPIRQRVEINTSMQGGCDCYEYPDTTKCMAGYLPRCDNGSSVVTELVAAPLPAWFEPDKTRTCELCRLLREGGELDIHCLVALSEICHQLCGPPRPAGEYEDGDYSHINLFRRFSDYWFDRLGLNNEDRAGHREAYVRQRRDLNTALDEWSKAICRLQGNLAQEFTELAGRWENRELQAAPLVAVPIEVGFPQPDPVGLFDLFEAVLDFDPREATVYVGIGAVMLVGGGLFYAQATLAGD